ncbi:MAG: hypothetical protein ACKVU1_08020 [bacterium]
MGSQIVLVVVAIIGVAAIAIAVRMARAFGEYRGERVVTCPETHAPVGVHVDASHAALLTARGGAGLRLSDCTRWPERAGCGQECLSEIAAAPHDCLVRVRLANWYAGKTCALCGEVFDEIRWVDAKPGLLHPDGPVIAWDDVHADKLDAVQSTHRPLCYDCFVAEAFRQRYPEMFTDRARH